MIVNKLFFRDKLSSALERGPEVERSHVRLSTIRSIFFLQITISAVDSTQTERRRNEGNSWQDIGDRLGYDWQSLQGIRQGSKKSMSISSHKVCRREWRFKRIAQQSCRCVSWHSDWRSTHGYRETEWLFHLM